MVIGDAVQAHDAAATEAGLSLRFTDCDESLRSTGLLMDAGRVRQVVTNFLSNAIKFTPAGGKVFVRARVQTASVDASDPAGAVVVHTATQSALTVRVSVVDTGRGLRPDEVSRLFLPYSQIRAAEMQQGCVGRTPSLVAHRGGGVAGVVRGSGSRCANISLRTGTGVRARGLRLNGRSEAAQLTGVSAGNIGAVSTPGEGSEFFFVARFPCVGVAVVGASEVPSRGS